MTGTHFPAGYLVDARDAFGHLAINYQSNRTLQCFIVQTVEPQRFVHWYSYAALDLLGRRRCG